MRAVLIALVVLYVVVVISKSPTTYSATPTVTFNIPEQITPTTSAAPTKDCMKSEYKFEDHWNKWSDKLEKKYGQVLFPEERNLIDGLNLSKGERKDINKIISEGRKLVADCGQHLNTKPEAIINILDTVDSKVNGVPG